ncbi:ParB/RepB/Spo0J family partition protein [Halopseudomonas pachastrellae]|nr:ParB/RepB/Spo0J family partition protein [Halopseudomonas pachastrellae]
MSPAGTWTRRRWRNWPSRFVPRGVMQPIVVRPISEGRYEIIAGERRWRASQLAGLDSIPAVIREVPDEAAIAMALIENIQREDLNPIEEAIALQRLQQEFELTQQQVADAVGKSRSASPTCCA